MALDDLIDCIELLQQHLRNRGTELRAAAPVAQGSSQ